MLKHVFVQYYKVTFTLGFDQNYELKSNRLDSNQPCVIEFNLKRQDFGFGV